MATKEDQLSYLGLHQYPPSELLKDYVHSYWTIHRQRPLKKEHKEFLHPDGGFGIIFNLADPLFMDGLTIKNFAVLDGANTISRVLKLKGEIRAFGIRFLPGGAYPFLNIPLTELENQNILLQDLSIPLEKHISEKLYNSKTPGEMVVQIDERLRNLLKKPHAVSPAIISTIKISKTMKGLVSLKGLLADIPVGQRQLERLYKQQIGFSPKKYLNILRVGHAREMLKKRDIKNGSAFSDIEGYTDQSHFIKEFKAIVGLTPKKYISRKKTG